MFITLSVSRSFYNSSCWRILFWYSLLNISPLKALGGKKVICIILVVFLQIYKPLRKDVVFKLGAGKEIREVFFKFKLIFFTEWHFFSSSSLIDPLMYSGIFPPRVLERLVIVGTWNDIQLSEGFINAQWWSSRGPLAVEILQWHFWDLLSLDPAPLTDHWPGLLSP